MIALPRSDSGLLVLALDQHTGVNQRAEVVRQHIRGVAQAGLEIGETGHVVVPHHRAVENDYSHFRHLTDIQKMGQHNMTFAAGTWGGEFNAEFGPQPGDSVAHEHWAQNGFTNTDLELLLRQRDIDKIIVVGFIANSCVKATARTGMELGFHVTLVEDATAAFSEAGMEAARTNGPMYAHAILDTDGVIELLQAAEVRV